MPSKEIYLPLYNYISEKGIEDIVGILRCEIILLKFPSLFAYKIFLFHINCEFSQFLQSNLET